MEVRDLVKGIDFYHRDVYDVDSNPPPLKSPVRHKSNRGDDG